MGSRLTHAGPRPQRRRLRAHSQTRRRRHLPECRSRGHGVRRMPPPDKPLVLFEHLVVTLARSCLTSRVDPSMSVKRKVTAPLGNSVIPQNLLTVAAGVARSLAITTSELWQFEPRQGGRAAVPPHPRRRDRCAGCDRPPPARPCAARRRRHAERSREPCTTSVGTVTASSSGSRLGAGADPRRARPQWERETEDAGSADRRQRCGTRPRARRPPTDDECQAAQLGREQVVDHRRPRRIELARRCGSSPPRHPVGLFDERHAQSHLVCNARDRNKIFACTPPPAP